MALENLVGADKFIAALVPSNPTGGDDKREGDDHIRGIKNTLKNSFPNVNAAVTATAAELSEVANKVNRAGDTMTGSLNINNAAIGTSILHLIHGFNANIHYGGVLFSSGGLVSAEIRSYRESDNYAGNEGDLRFYTNFGNPDGSQPTSEKMRIAGGGALTVGGVQDASGHIFYQKGAWTLALAPDLDRGLVVSMPLAAAAGAIYAHFARGGVQVGSITQVGTTGVAYGTTSDYRLKENLGPLPASGAFIDALIPRGWTWKDGSGHGAGFVAHELEAVSPSSVSGAKDGVDKDGKPEFQSVFYGSPEIIANIVAELKSLRARVAALEALTVA